MYLQSKKCLGHVWIEFKNENYFGPHNIKLNKKIQFFHS